MTTRTDVEAALDFAYVATSVGIIKGWRNKRVARHAHGALLNYSEASRSGLSSKLKHVS